MRPNFLFLLGALLSFGCRSAKPEPVADATPTLGGPRDTTGAAPSPSSAATEAAAPSDAPLIVTSPDTLTRRPVAALYERSPWSSVIGAEIPLIVVYADGTALRQEPPNEGETAPRITQGKIPSVDALLASLSEELLAVPAHSSLRSATDQPTTTLLVDTGRGWIRRSVYGMAPGCRPPTGADPVDPTTPRLVRACTTLREVELTERSPFKVEELEILLWSYEHSPEVPASWPATLPTPPDQAPSSGRTLAYRVPGRFLDAFRAFHTSLAPRQAVLVHGKKWSTSLRLTFPGDAYLDEVQRHLSQRVESEFDQPAR